jgi:hypothetical protein
MLEHQSLLLLPWSGPPGASGNGHGSPTSSERRLILDATTRLPLGFVRRRPGPRSTLRRLTQPGAVLEVHEAEDESLLFMLRGPRALSLPWLEAPAWEIHDADGQRLARLQPLESVGREPFELAVAGWDFRRDCCLWLAGTPLGLTREVRFLIECQPSEASFLRVTTATGCLQDLELAALMRGEEGMFLHFAHSFAAEPFAKMLALAALLLALERVPRDGPVLAS